MSVTAIVGAQWGDEGKGRVVDYLAQKAEVVIRFQGGDNAGHTVINDKGKFALHIVPSGIFNPETVCIVGAGTVVNFDTMSVELDTVKAAGVNVDNLFIDRRAHLILPFHCLLDGAEEASKKSGWAVGTTKRGIGPCYSDKANRVGIRAADILDEERLRTRLQMMLPQKNRQLHYYGIEEVQIEDLMDLAKKWRARYGDKIIDTLPVVKKAILSDKNIVLEGQLGIMRDLDWGIYPYTTSSNPTAGGACSGAGISPRRIDEIIGVLKVYSTSVGGGPFPTELLDSDGERLRTIGAEFGATTGRPRRCGWFDALIVRHSVIINNMDEIVLTKLDVLDELEQIKICTGYRYKGKTIKYFPSNIEILFDVKPVYEVLPGWMSDTSHIKHSSRLPKNARGYIDRLSDLVGARITMVSVGTDRKQILKIK